MEQLRATTILSVRRGKKVSLGGDGQVTLGDSVMKHQANKLRTLANGKVIAGFAGGVADAFTLLEMLENKLGEYGNNLVKASVEMAREWRTDKMLRNLDSLIMAVDNKNSLIISGRGEVIQPDDGVLGIGSGGNLACSAARALLRNTKMKPEDMVKESLQIASEICIYTNQNINILNL